MRGVSRVSRAQVGERLAAIAADADADALQGLAGELFSVVHLLDDEPRVRRVLSDPGLAPQQRTGLVDGLLAGLLSDHATELVRAVAETSWSQPSDVVDAIDELAAEALFASAEAEGGLDDVEDELFRFGRIVDREPALRRVLTDRALPVERKQDVLDALLDGKVRPATRRLIDEVVLHARGRTLDRGIDEYVRLAAERRERLVALVTTVVPLSEEQASRLEAGLAEQLGHQVHLNIEIDPDLVGGISVRVGDQLFDGSIARRITEVHRLMAG